MTFVPRQALRARYLSTFPRKIAEIEDALALAARRGEPGLDALRMAAHRLAGSGASYGWPEITEAARRLERAVDAGAYDEAATGLCSVLRAIHEQHAAKEGPAS